MSPAVAAADYQDGEGTYSRSTTRAGGKRVRRQGGTATRTEVLLALDQWPCAGCANGRVNEVQKTACCLSTDVDELRHGRTCPATQEPATRKAGAPAAGNPCSSCWHLSMSRTARFPSRGAPENRQSTGAFQQSRRRFLWQRERPRKNEIRMFLGEAAAERCVAGGIGEYKPGGTGTKLPEAHRALLLVFLACLPRVV